ncbi:MAG TPA: transglutaminase-like cysteine peptidase [Devosia sp.]|nr:transglutaminase-like cysteine peptidase [Devosia sp.]
MGALMALAAIISPTQALDTAHVAFVQTVGGTTSIPVGHAEFCNSRPDECRAYANPVELVPLTEGLWQQLLSVNAGVNQHVVPVTDQDLYQVAEFWTYPNGYGDCEDYALAKRRELINAGWPASTLLMAVVKQANGEGHAVLMVRTDRGDLVLDNQVGSVDLWSQTPYKFIKRQSQANAGQWVDMIDDRDIVVTTAAIN